MSFDSYEISPYNGTPERLFLFTAGNTQWSYNNQERDIIRGSVTYRPIAIAMDNIVQNLGEGPPTIEITMDGSAPVMAQFVPYQPVYPLYVTVFRRHRDDPDGEYIVEMIGDVAAASFDEEEGFATLSCRMVSSNFDRRVPWMIYQRQCNYALYGAGCRVNKELYKIETTATAVTNDVILASAFASQPDGWLRNGFVKRNSTGEVRFILNHVGGQITLQTPFTDLNPGDAITAYAGCDRLYDTCVNKFNNGPRFSGFLWVPSKNPFTENVYGTGTAGTSGSSSTNWRKAVNPAGWNGSWGMF